MRVNNPWDIVVLESNVPIPEVPWAADGVYAKDALVLVDGQQVYKSLINNNTGKYPPDYSLGDSPAWSHAGPTNRHKALDERNTSQTEQADSIQYLLVGTNRDSLDIFNVEANVVVVELLDPATQDVLWKSVNTMIEPVDNAWDACFTDPMARSDLHLSLPFFIASGVVVSRNVRITLSLPGGICRCGAIIMGQAQYLGETVGEINGENLSWSTFDDSFGELYLQPGRTARKMTIQVEIERSNMDRACRILDAVDGRLVVWVLHNDRGNAFDTMTVRGALRKARPLWKSGPIQTVSLDIQTVAK